MGADDRLHQGVVDTWRSWDPWSSACWRHDLFPAPLVAQGERDVHRDGAAVLAQGGAAELTDFHGWPCQSCRLLVRAGPAQLGAERGEPFDPQAEVDAVGLQVNAFDQQLDDAGLLCRE